MVIELYEFCSGFCIKIYFFSVTFQQHVKTDEKCIDFLFVNFIIEISL